MMISVVMPVYNHEEYLREAVESILGQTFRNFEFIVINDGSTDNTPKILRSYHDMRLRVVDFKKHRGLVAALNHGLKKARGRYLARMDADDISLPCRLERQFYFMEAHPAIVACGTFFESFYLDGTRKLKTYSVNPDEIRCELLFGSPIAHPTAIIRRHALETNGIKYDPNFKEAEDYDFWIKLSKVGKLANLPEVLFLRRVHEKNKCLLGISEVDRVTKKIISQQLKELGLEFVDLPKLPKSMAARWVAKLIWRNFLLRKYPILACGRVGIRKMYELCH